MTDKEIEIVLRLLKDESELLSYFHLHRHSLQVEEMNDGGMGSLSFVNPGKVKRVFGGRIGQEQFQDEDGVPILISVYLDQDGELFELDVWKVDFSPTKNIILNGVANVMSFNELARLNGRKSSQENCKLLKKEFPELAIDWLIAAMLEFPLAGCNFFLESIDFDMEWMTVGTMLEEGKEFYPGISAIRHNYFPIGTCLYGSGNPYFVDLNEVDKKIVQIPHDAIDTNMQLKVDEVEVIFPTLIELFKHAQLNES